MPDSGSHVRHGGDSILERVGFNVGVNATYGRGIMADDLACHHVGYAGILEQAGRRVSQAVAWIPGRSGASGVSADGLARR
jgi:hypothetical protein